MTEALSTVPWLEKSRSSAAESTEKPRFPTNSFVPIVIFPSTEQSEDPCWLSGSCERGRSVGPNGKESDPGRNGGIDRCRPRRSFVKPTSRNLAADLRCHNRGFARA